MVNRKGDQFLQNSKQYILYSHSPCQCLTAASPVSQELVAVPVHEKLDLVML